MRIAFLTPEAAPYSKTGGLGDVGGSLPVALARLGHQVTLFTPLYRDARVPGLTWLPGELHLSFPFGPVHARLGAMEPEPNLAVRFVDIPHFFERGGFYGHRDDARRFAAYTMAVVRHLAAQQPGPDVVWSHDWQAGLAPLLVRSTPGPLARALTVFTIHNLAYQGNFPAEELAALGIPWDYYTVDGLEFYHQMSFLKGGLQFAALLTTVSPTYAGEILTPEGGWGLDGVLRQRADRLHGILNGIDVGEWNPATDRLLPARYSREDLKGRAENRAALVKAFGVEPPREGMPLFGVVSRLVEQKGIDLVLGAISPLLAEGASVVVLGTGDWGLEEGWRRLHQVFPRRVGLNLGFDNALAHLVEAGCDFFLMPSRFEPCGLNQMYSLVYGAVPVVRAVGGLKDTVVDVSRPDGTGIVFDAPTPAALLDALWRAVALYRDRPALDAVQARGMALDFSWHRAARLYEALLARHLPR